MLEEKKNLEKKNQELKNSKEDNALIQKNLLKNYLGYITEYHDLGTNPEEVVNNGISMITHFSTFAEHAAEKVKEIVDELYLPENLRDWHPRSKKYLNGGIVGEVPVKLLYQIENITVTVAIPAYVEKLHLIEAGWLNPNVVEEGSVNSRDRSEKRTN